MKQHWSEGRLSSLPSFKAQRRPLESYMILLTNTTPINWDFKGFTNLSNRDFSYFPPNTKALPILGLSHLLFLLPGTHSSCLHGADSLLMKVPSDALPQRGRPAHSTQLWPWSHSLSNPHFFKIMPPNFTVFIELTVVC